MYSKISIVPVSPCEMTITLLFEKIFTMNIIDILLTVFLGTVLMHADRYSA